ncbi:MAG TPA: ABC transporter permease subunit [Pseudonocardiaceae bacterium]|jgi:ABC-type transport system involved in multi-copper enzyme maturation permease subunit|nr:ABC transporter permease subunit [Pseudonocardiaceae bacterium]
MLASLRAELFKLRKRTALWLIVVAWLVLSLLFGYVFPYLSYHGIAAGPEAASGASAQRVLAGALPADLVPSAIQGFPVFAGALALILGVLCVGSEYSWQTVKVMFSQGPRRFSVLAGKTASVLLVMLMIVVLTFAVDALAALLIASITSGPVSWPPIGDLLRGVGAGWLIVGMWALAGMFLGFILRGTALAVGIGLVWTLAVENLLRAFASTISAINVLQRWFPGTNAGSLAAALGVPTMGKGGDPGITATVSGQQATLVLIGYLVVFVAISTVLVNRRDIT